MAKKKTASAAEVKKFTSQTLKTGSKGPAVGYLQQQLNNKNVKVSVDEVFGPNTKKAVKAFQKKKKLSADGIAGTKTWGALTDSKSGAAAKDKSAPGDTADDDKRGRNKKERNTPDPDKCLVRLRVTCRSSGRGMMPVQGAEVRIGKIKTRTATNGDASLSIPPGRYKAEVTKRGYRLDADNRGFELRASAGGQLEVNIEMVPE